MKRAVLVGVSALAEAVGMLASGFIAGRPHAATAGRASTRLVGTELLNAGV